MVQTEGPYLTLDDSTGQVIVDVSWLQEQGLIDASYPSGVFSLSLELHFRCILEQYNDAHTASRFFRIIHHEARAVQL